jgi:hypothetical protein
MSTSNNLLQQRINALQKNYSVIQSEIGVELSTHCHQEMNQFYVQGPERFY